MSWNVSSSSITSLKKRGKYDSSNSKYFAKGRIGRIRLIRRWAEGNRKLIHFNDKIVPLKVVAASSCLIRIKNNRRVWQPIILLKIRMTKICVRSSRRLAIVDTMTRREHRKLPWSKVSSRVCDQTFIRRATSMQAPVSLWVTLRLCEWMTVVQAPWLGMLWTLATRGWKMSRRKSSRSSDKVRAAITNVAALEWTKCYWIARARHLSFTITTLRMTLRFSPLILGTRP